MRFLTSAVVVAALAVVGCGDDSSNTGGSAGTGGTAGTPEAQAFCAQYETTCGFGGADRFADMDACISGYDSFAPSRQACVEQHLGFATDDPTTHCPHAAGAPPCGP